MEGMDRANMRSYTILRTADFVQWLTIVAENSDQQPSTSLALSMEAIR